MESILSEYIFGDICVQYRMDDQTKMLGLQLLPNGMQEKVQPKRQAIDPLMQVMIRGDGFPDGFANGHTMRNNASMRRFAFAGQEKQESANSSRIITKLKTEDGHQLTQQLDYISGEKGLHLQTTYTNGSDAPAIIDMLSSFCLGGITPFVGGDAPGCLMIHRLRSKWSNEARLESISTEDLQLEPSWSGYGVACERFGQTGSMPVRKYFPMMAIEDTTNHVMWGGQLGCPSSWQMELYRRDDALCISGGLADDDFGHWHKTIQPSESFTTPVASLTVCVGTIDALSARLTAMQATPLQKLAMPARLPVVFNEFCTTWGNPSQENIQRILAHLKGRDIDYFVIDAGWYADEVKGWDANMGDWEINRRLFPDGLESVVDAIHHAGLKAGIWFEPEVCGQDARAYQQTDHLLKRNGTPISTGRRRFWNLCDPWVKNYLERHVIELLKRYGFEYIKIDYNDSIGIGCDHPDGLGEGLRQNQLAAQSLMTHIRESIPGILVENCSSGGHRLEPSFLSVSQLSSFSDAHEVREIPVVAANLHRAMLPRQSLIWAVLRKNDTPKRMIWSLCATCLGVMCLSGDIYDLSEDQWSIVEEGIHFYRAVSSVIEKGETIRHGSKINSYRHPEGWQTIERTAESGGEKLIVAHVFDAQPVEIRVALKGKYQISDRFADPDCQTWIEGEELVMHLADGACALHLQQA